MLSVEERIKLMDLLLSLYDAGLGLATSTATVYQHGAAYRAVEEYVVELTDWSTAPVQQAFAELSGFDAALRTRPNGQYLYIRGRT